MSEEEQRVIIQEQIEANERLVRLSPSVPHKGIYKGQAPVNERVKQISPNERVQQKPVQTPKPKAKP